MSILLIDDDPDSNQLAYDILSAAGYEVQVATSVQEARQMLLAAFPDLILVGLSRPTTEGAVLISTMSAHPGIHHTPIVTLGPIIPSAAGIMHETRAQLDKPFDRRSLLSTVQHCIETARREYLSTDSDQRAGQSIPPLPRRLAERLTSETVRIQEEERRKLSLELHDEIAQIMGNLILMIDASMAVAPPESKRLQQYLENARKTAKEGFRRVQRFSVELRPPMLDDLGLAPTIVWYAERFTRETSIPIEVALPDRLPSLNGEQETSLFRIIQEALNNIRKHSEASSASVTIELRPGKLRLEIVDNGKGFDLDELGSKVVEANHFGLAGIRYRASLVNGTLDIDSHPGQGTSIIVEMPLGAHAPF